MRLSVNYKWFWLDLGWFSGNEVELFTISVGQTVSDYPSGIASIALISLQIVKFLFAFGWAKE